MRDLRHDPHKFPRRPQLLTGEGSILGVAAARKKSDKEPPDEVLRLVCNWRVIAVIAVSIVESRIFTSVPAEERSNFHAPQVIRRRSDSNNVSDYC
jgi:hypothetical protein